MFFQAYVVSLFHYYLCMVGLEVHTYIGQFFTKLYVLFLVAGRQVHYITLSS